MHPVLILVPAAALVFGPRLWVGHVLKEYNRLDEDFPGTAADLARRLLDERGLQRVRVEVTDLGDHYDHRVKSVRLARDKHDRRTLTALTTAAHEVAHAIQDASGYAPFVWRTYLAKLAQVTGEAGSVLLLAVPAAAFLGRGAVPPSIVGAAALSMLGTGVVAQLAALPTELDASFNRALPMLRDAPVDEEQLQDARRILLACSLTYVASSLVSVLNIWPWIGRPTYLSAAGDAGRTGRALYRRSANVGRLPRRNHGMGKMQELARRRSREEDLFRRIAKRLIRGWLRITPVA